MPLIFLRKKDKNMINTYVSIDLETTGLNPKLDKIIEVGAIKVVDGHPGEPFKALVNPGRKLEERITELTGITDEELQNAPYIDEVFPRLFDYLEDLPLLGHSILFDYSFLKKEAVNRKLFFEKLGIDTLKIARKYLPDLESRSLGFLCRHYAIPHQAHRAYEDAVATVRLYERLVQEYYSEEEALFVPAPLLFKIKKDSPATKAQKERLYRLIEQHKIEEAPEVEHMTRSEASRYTDKLLATYGRYPTVSSLSDVLK